jgi:DNA-binding MarR family transcriptional regulator
MSRASRGRATQPYTGVTELRVPALMRENYDRAIEQIFDQLHEAGFTDVRRSHAPVIGFPGPHGARPGELAARTGRSKQHINVLLGELETAGYLVREPDEKDQRGKIIYLTDRGMELAAAVKKSVQQVEADWQSVLGSRRFAALRQSLEDLQRREGPG